MEDKLEDKPKIDEKLAKTIGQVSTTHPPLVVFISNPWYR